MIRSVAAAVMAVFLLMSNAAYAKLGCSGLVDECEMDTKQPLDAKSVTRKDMTYGIMCIGYLQGAMDAQSASHAPLFCPPENAGLHDTARVFVDWAKRHPEHMQDMAGSCLVVALSEAYPCPSH